MIFMIWAMIFVFVPFLGGKEKGGGLYWAEGTLKSGKSHLPEIDEKRRVLVERNRQMRRRKEKCSDKTEHFHFFTIHTKMLVTLLLRLGH